MRQVLIAFALFGFAACGRLESQYLPPNKGGSSSGTAQYSASGQYSASASSSAAVQIPILRLDTQNDGDGTYSFTYETGNSINAQEQGTLKGDDLLGAQGSFSYTAPDGQQISITYTADENGFQPKGAHIPTAPPIPEEILKALAQNEADEARGIIDDGQYHEEQYGQQQSYQAGSGSVQKPSQSFGTPTRQGYKY